MGGAVPAEGDHREPGYTLYTPVGLPSTIHPAATPLTVGGLAGADSRQMSLSTAPSLALTPAAKPTNGASADTDSGHAEHKSTAHTAHCPQPDGAGTDCAT